ncbi:XTP/dITP diphosphatase [Staphylococcus pseudintermedius]|uniref:dITP/XTP pyrophosphatase n=3 Tax=Bacteria TaxID=2 RepID=A0A3D8ZAJ0_STAPS|nr:XTP/dITP diphosphatase [Staphylococcus pseudintermedius]ADV05380.1 Nucleoside 5-triphosphatase RdgB [Staphylococcus pseudintermedius HKU10-03]ADX76901.1 non-canonical purine NTP pyrophosphatase, RdgB/HAM1 family [Staphylococcus pseudintermedius ED99]ANQ82147.1 non-canonical purine NTP pyrophosphatase [Staphylococcus pseudintermedius]ANQ88606.1 non-canonical purine NTP pyrophosphatase [Staphylococcus pseudintermedius]AYG56941.1 XTP/dITP diphosphatase [Staphylococcus pseudintermedius]
MADIVIASSNQGKINDFKVIFSEDNVIGINEMIEDFDVEETGTTFEENARLKSEAAAKLLNATVIADDSGLEVAALNGEPGVYSARYAGVQKSDEANIEKVLKGLENEENRAARFVCVISMTTATGETTTFKGTVEGEITLSQIGENGFGYDPIFLIPERQKTMAQLTAEEKSEISHRRKAIDQLKAYIEGEEK